MVPVAAMGDIAFLLIIFFVICGRLAKDPDVDVHPPTTLKVVKLEDYPNVVIVDAKGPIYYQGTEVKGGVSELESELTLALENKSTDEERTVLFRCDYRVIKDKFEPVIEAIAKAGGQIAAIGNEPEAGSINNPHIEPIPNESKP